MPSRRSLPTKPCQVCGREMTWRKAWARTWDDVRYCSDACRARGRRSVDDVAESLIAASLRGSGHPLDPESLLPVLDAHRGAMSDAELREAVHSAARRMAARGEVEVVVKGRVVEPSRVTGPMQVRATAAQLHPQR